MKPLHLPVVAAAAVATTVISLSAQINCSAFILPPSLPTSVIQPFSSYSTRSPTTIVQTTKSSNDEAEQELTNQFIKQVTSSYNEKNNNNNSPPPPKKYVIIGGGWAGWGAAKALCQGLPYTIPTTEPTDIGNYQFANITLIDALPDPTGSTPYLSKTGKPVEAGTRGFWKDYPNINKLCEQLGLEENYVFTPFTNSSFYSPDGLEATAPVFSEATVGSILGDVPLVGDVLKNALLLARRGKESGGGGGGTAAQEDFPMLPSPLGQVIATIPYFERLPIADRASMVGLLLATIDCLGGDENVKRQYDRMTAHELFLRFRLSERLVEDFLKPTLLVGLFKPPEELSALVVMELLYYYALAHQDSFDVRWIKSGTVSDSLIQPLAKRLMKEEYGQLNVLGGCRVKEVSIEKKEDGKMHATKLRYFDTKSGQMETIDGIDGIIMAVGNQGMSSIVSSSPDLAKFPVFSKAASLKGIDVISCRLWFDRKVSTRSPANVFSRFDALRGAGGTFFMLDQLQEDSPELWGEDARDERGSVVACDFYNAGGLMSLSDEDLVKILTDELLPSAVTKFADAKLVESWVGKYPGVVSWFSPGSYDKRPPLEGAGKDVLPNIKCAGDWVRMGEREHGAKGLCQERAYVSGFEAANSLMKSTCEKFQPHEVLPVREDEMQFKMGIELNQKVMQYLPRFWTR
jgi:uncharacterized protein with NAD-binding domain and iron-sulfur cluster